MKMAVVSVHVKSRGTDSLEKGKIYCKNSPPMRRRRRSNFVFARGKGGWIEAERTWGIDLVSKDALNKKEVAGCKESIRSRNNSRH